MNKRIKFMGRFYVLSGLRVSQVVTCCRVVVISLVISCKATPVANVHNNSKEGNEARLIEVKGSASQHKATEEKEDRSFSRFSFDNLIPPGLIASSNSTLVMIGTDTCPTSKAFKPIFLENEKLSGDVDKVYIDIGKLRDLAKFYPTPYFVLFQDGVPVDMHAGVVHPINFFATKTNKRIFEHILIRNGLMIGDKWALVQNNLSGSAANRNFDYQALSFLEMNKVSFGASSFKHTLFSGVMLQNANFEEAVFERTIMAHVDLRGARFRPNQIAEILWLGSICPDGTLSDTHGNTCAGHIHVSEQD